jgi:hypothetical protein
MGKSLLLILVASGSLFSQRSYWGFRFSQDDIQLSPSQSHFTTQTGSRVRITTPSNSRTFGIGTEILIPLDYDETWIGEVSAFYRSSTLFGNSTYKYNYDVQDSGADSSLDVPSDMSYAGLRIGVGLNLTDSWSTTVLRPSIGIGLHLGSVVYPDDAYQEYAVIGRLPTILTGKQTFFLGVNGQLHAGVALDGRQRFTFLILSPGVSYDWKLTNKNASNGGRFSYQISLGLFLAI